MRSIQANRAALAQHGARVELCVCGGQILAIDDSSGIRDAVRNHQLTAAHRRWRGWQQRRGYMAPCRRRAQLAAVIDYPSREYPAAASEAKVVA